MEGQVVVYVIHDEHHEDRRSRIRNIFKKKDFHVVYPEIPYKDVDMEVGNRRYELYDRHEAYQAGWCLADAKEKYPANPTLIIKDSSLCAADQDTVSDVIHSSLSNKESFHVCYLCKWNDKCQLHSRKKRVKGTMSHLAKTQSPHGVQALLFTPEGRDVVLGVKPMKNGEFFKARESLGKSLNVHIVKGNLDAFCVVPNLIAYDISLALEDRDYLKVNECAPVLALGGSGSSAINIYVAALVIIILFIIIVWAAIYVSP